MKTRAPELRMKTHAPELRIKTRATGYTKYTGLALDEISSSITITY